MKKLLILFFAFLCSMGMWAEQVKLTENFTSSKAANDAYNCSSDATTATNQADWDYVWTPVKATVFNSGIKIGTGNAVGSLTNSTMLKDIPEGTEITVKIYAAQWDTDGKNIKFTYNNASETKAPSNAAITSTTSNYSASDFSTSTDFTITKAAANDFVIATSGKGRVLIDKVEVVYEGTNSGSTTKFDITIDNHISHGSVTSSYTSAAEGTTVTLTANADLGYAFESWNVTNASTSEVITVTNNAFTMPAANVKVSAIFAESDEVVIWSEDFSSVEFPSGKTTQPDMSKITSATFELTAEGGTTMAVYKNDNIASGTAPEILIPKRKDTNNPCVVTVTINDLKGCSGDMVLTFNSNIALAATGTLFTTSTPGATITKGKDTHEWNISVPNGATKLSIAITNTTTTNDRFDDFLLVGKKPKAPVTPEAKTIDFVAAGTDGYYTTFSNDKAVTFPDMIEVGENYAQLTVYTVYAVGNLIELQDQTSKLLYDDTWYLSENEGYLIKAEYSGDVAFTGSKAFGVEYTELDYNLNGQDTENALRPASEAKTGGNKYYMLAYGDEALTPATLGFYWGAANGAAFVSREGSAYLSIPASTNLAKGFSFSNTQTTGIKDIKDSKSKNVIYNLAGQRVNANAKGLVIMNGKKMFNK